MKECLKQSNTGTPKLRARWDCPDAYLMVLPLITFLICKVWKNCISEENPWGSVWCRSICSICRWEQGISRSCLRSRVSHRVMLHGRAVRNLSTAVQARLATSGIGTLYIQNSIACVMHTCTCIQKSLHLQFYNWILLYRISTLDVDALKKSLSSQTPSTSETYTVTLKAGREEMKIDIEFKPDGNPEVTSMSGKGSLELNFDVVYLHR